MTKYQLQASDKWSFDFVKEAPIASVNNQFKWEPATVMEMPKFYHQISHQSSRPARYPSSVNNELDQLLFNGYENACPLLRHINLPLMITQNSMAGNKRKMVLAVSSSSKILTTTTTVSSSQRKITGEWCFERR